jgi:transglutaminase-like putative cysteine protease
MIYRIRHSTRYVYHQPVSLCYNLACLTPRGLPWQDVLETRLEIDPPPAERSERLDFFGNRVHFFAVHHPHEALSVTAESRVAVAAAGRAPDPAPDADWREQRARLNAERSGEGLDARAFAFESPLVPAASGIADYAQPSFAPGRGLLAAVTDLVHRIHRDFEYMPTHTTVATPISEVLRHRKGVCQDFAHLAIAGMRAMGLAARYVSGYIETLPPPGRPRLVGADASHAWVSVFFPGAGWLDFDPTNDRRPGDQHITVAWGRDYADVAPLKGVVFSSGTHALKVSVDVAREAAA